MGQRTSYENGTFSWVDLGTTDQEAAKTFYSALFGWEFEDLPVGDGASYSMARLDGQNVAAVATQNEQERRQGIPPHWNNYVTAHDVDERAPRISELGGNLLMPPFDVLEAGRMAVGTDPTGAVFMLWQPVESIGAGLVNAPGALAWNELGTSDPEAAKRFYADLFDWTYDDLDMGEQGTYSIIRQQERSNGGIRAQTPMEAGVPSNWLPYFGVDSCEDTAAKAQDNAGRVLVPKVTVPAGSFAVIADPQGAVFALFEGQFDD